MIYFILIIAFKSLILKQETLSLSAVQPVFAFLDNFLTKCPTYTEKYANYKCAVQWVFTDWASGEQPDRCQPTRSPSPVLPIQSLFLLLPAVFSRSPGPAHTWPLPSLARPHSQAFETLPSLLLEGIRAIQPVSWCGRREAKASGQMWPTVHPPAPGPAPPLLCMLLPPCNPGPLSPTPLLHCT